LILPDFLIVITAGGFLTASKTFLFGWLASHNLLTPLTWLLLAYYLTKDDGWGFC